MRPYDIAKPVLFSLPAETAHSAVHGLLEAAQGTPIAAAMADRYTVSDDRLAASAFGQSFDNPVGVAAGFDKNATVPNALGAMGFGFAEVGGVTAEPQAGNARPRMFRLREDDGIINRMGLNNEGAAAVGERLAKTDAPFPLGVNIAKSEHVGTSGAPADYRETYEHVAEGGDFFVVNVSCPNSQGFEELQNRDAMTAIFAELQDAGAAPLLVKLSPDLPEPAVEDTLDLVTELDLDGVVATNTTTERPEGLRSPNASETGGLSGKPIEDRATDMVQFVAERVDVPVVGVGGVASAEGAYQKIRAGASLVQLYTGLVYEGPSLARDINEGLLDLLERDGFDSVEDAVGADL
ncbi:quinone-dependent dihydroorotate dehydrogenase [Haloarcula salinisoli]|uniref:Dihydroorotate dehydrogenase (quinone) n=1 Tax=Haloarcula salinisoli TaxID=2487746 RepID=A0A8J8CCR8_9EURY|nr:quinone-dependent dihydroorotate dehydrogenase [Halomicroarcula salinisoli]MBX0286471.1 quinone-dependent dihydroorotate dehydrogenase [Halomicroarcula salinisoli]MBX0303820.1 quinone-dependent dihydroorotate dehydrogenase [Halomicroarcula salinisoli]